VKVPRRFPLILAQNGIPRSQPLMQDFLKQIANYRLLFVLLPILYFGLYGFYGFGDTDQGFVTALSYRVQLGEQPYTDFSYVRPPLTPLLHALELKVLPLSLQMIGMRLTYFLMLWLTVWMSIQILQRFFDFEQAGISKWLLASLGYILALQNYPPMAWHTTDGIFFGVLGVYLITQKPKLGLLELGLLSLFLAALAKQPFALLFPSGVVLVLFLHPRKQAAISVVVASLIVLAMGWGLTKQYPGMLSQIAGSAKFNDLLTSGVRGYMRPFLLFVLPVTLGLWLLGQKLNKPKLAQVCVAAVLLAWVGWYAWIVMDSLRDKEYVIPAHWFYHVLWLASVVLALADFWEKRWRSGMVILMLAAISWASAISWGFQLPSLFCLQGLFSALVLLKRLGKVDLPRWVYPALTALGFVAFFLMNQYPYRDGKRSELTHDAGEVFEGLSHIRTGPYGYGKLQEFKRLYETYHDPYFVLPKMPLAHYLTQSKSPVGIDWGCDGEIGAGQYPRLLAQMNQPGVTVFVEKYRRDELKRPKDIYSSDLLRAVLTDWTLIDSGEVFLVYRRPSL
jgi:hypothetical protein